MDTQSSNSSTVESRYAQADATLSTLLARGFLRPVASFITVICDGSYADQLASVLEDSNDKEIGGALASIRQQGKELAVLDAEEARLELEVDYNRLFVGPGKLLAPPYESFYVSEPDETGRGTICGTPMLAVKNYYNRFGTEIPEDFVDYPDHIAFELEFLSLLAKEEARCLEQGEVEAAVAFQEGAAEFRDKHLGMWAQVFAKNVKENAETALYPALAQLLIATQI